MQKLANRYYTHEEYLALEESAEYKSEYYQGEIFAFAGASANHNQIVINLVIEIGSSLKNKKCRIYANDMRIWVKSLDLFTYPDLAIICNNPEFYPDRDDTITNPLVILEVLSESTQDYDRGRKFLFYRSIPTLQEYILVDQYKSHIEQFYLDAEGKWLLSEYNDINDILKFSKIDFQISLKEVYNLVEF